ncbi:MAG: hypothetical protein HKN41_08860 [Ilumatobacter sp.]|nr:hypothetical protein [Ilumatobacter sp.]
MGQLVGVVEKPSSAPGVVRFELNRSLTGMGHERYISSAPVVGDTPAAALARMLFDTGKVDGIHVYGNMVTVDVAKGHDSSGLSGLVQEMYRYWKPGVRPPSFEDLQPDEPAAVEAGDGDGGDAGLSKAQQLVPAHLLERSRLGRERWNAKAG